MAIDLSGRAFARFEGRFGREQVGGLPTELVPHFFHSLAESLGAAVHVSVTGENSHHMIEACFKGVGRALRQAFRRESDELADYQGSVVVEAVIIDSGGANLASLQFAFERLGAKTHVTADPAAIRSAPRVILPGVGSAGDAMAAASQTTASPNCCPTLTQPVLGICLGMQLLFERSEEGDTACLGILPDTVRRLQPAAGQARAAHGLESTLTGSRGSNS